LGLKAADLALEEGHLTHMDGFLRVNQLLKDPEILCNLSDIGDFNFEIIPLNVHAGIALTFLNILLIKFGLRWNLETHVIPILPQYVIVLVELRLPAIAVRC
jgi:hypothetical protein